MSDIREYPKLFTAKECKEIITILDTTPISGTGIQINKIMVDKLLKIVGHKFPDYSFTEHISIGTTTAPIGRHVDPLLDKRVTHKLLVYLNELSWGGGTFFDGGTYIKPELGKAVVFNITLPHHGEGFPKGEVKRVFGMRMFKKNL